MSRILARAAPALAALVSIAACSDNIPTAATPPSARAVVTSQLVVTPAAPEPQVATTVPAVVPPNSTAPVVAAIPGPAIAMTTAAVVPARLTAGELRDVITGNTMSGVARNGRQFYSWFNPDGRLSFRQDEFRDKGEWSISSDGQLCSRLTKTNAGVADCYAFYRNGTYFNVARPDGTTISTIAILPGDPRNL